MSARRRLGGGIALRARRWAAARGPQRSRVARALRAPRGTATLPETGQIIARYHADPEGAAVSPPVDLPDVSVVIPAYNTERWLDDCLSSVRAQTGASVEILCVNDGSTDRTRAVAERHRRADGRVRIIDQPNSGQSVGRNAGLDAARGRYVVYVDSDDFWVGDHLADLVRRADRDRLDVLLFDGIPFRDGAIDEGVWRRYAVYYVRARRYSRPRTGPRMMADMRRNGDYLPHLGMFLSRTDFVRSTGIRFIPGIVHQDNPYTFALLLRATRSAHLRLCFYARRLRPGSAMTDLRATASAKGYYVSLVAMTRELARHPAQVATQAGIVDVVRAVERAALAQLGRVSSDMLDDIRACEPDSDARAIFDRLRTRSEAD